MPRRSGFEWDAGKYHQLGGPHVTWGQRVLASLDLEGDETVLDAGCGTGRLTAELLERLPEGRVIAVDRSRSMIERARAELKPVYGDRVTFMNVNLVELDLREDVDLIFSNQTFHWIRDQAALFSALFWALKPGGLLIAQHGGGQNLAELLERAGSIMAVDPFRKYFDGWPGPWLFSDDVEARERLETAGFADVETSLEPAPTQLADPREYREFLETVIFGAHLVRIPEPKLRTRFIDVLAKLGEKDDPPFLLDYWRLNLRGRRP